MYLNIYQKIMFEIEQVTQHRILHKKFVRSDNTLAVLETSKNGQIYATGICTYFEVVEVIFNEDTKLFSDRIKIFNDFKTVTVTVDKSKLTNRNLSELSANGMSINEEYTSAVLEYIFLEEKKANFVTESSFAGWKNNHFWGLTREKDIRYVGGLKLETSENYDKKKLNELLENAPSLQFCAVVGAGSCLQAYLAQHIPLETQIVHLFGNSSQGKTSGAMLAASAFGKPTVESGLLSTWNQTELSLMDKLKNNFGVCIALDESTIKTHSDFTSIVYNLSQGINRQRMNKNLTKTPTKQWLTTIISTGESGILECSKENSGLKARVFEFDRQITVNAEHSDKIKKFVCENYGYAAEVIKYLEESEVNDILEAYNKVKADFSESLKIKCSISERLLNSYAVWILTAVLLNQLGFGIDIKNIKSILRHQHTEVCKTFNMGETVYNAVCSHIVNKRYNYAETSSTLSEFGSIEGLLTKDGKVIMLASVFEKIIKDNKFPSTKMCLKELDRMGVLVKQRKDTFYSKRTIGRVLVKCIVIDLRKGGLNDEV